MCAGLELTSAGKPERFTAPPDYVFTARSAVMVEGKGKCALFIETRDLYGESVKRCLGYLDAPFTNGSQLRLDMAFGFGEAVDFSIEPQPGNSTMLKVHLCGFVSPVVGLEGVAHDSSSDEEEEAEYNFDDDEESEGEEAEAEEESNDASADSEVDAEDSNDDDASDFDAAPAAPLAGTKRSLATMSAAEAASPQIKLNPKQPTPQLQPKQQQQARSQLVEAAPASAAKRPHVTPVPKPASKPAENMSDDESDVDTLNPSTAAPPASLKKPAAAPAGSANAAVPPQGKAPAVQGGSAATGAASNNRVGGVSQTPQQVMQKQQPNGAPFSAPGMGQQSKKKKNKNKNRNSGGGGGGGGFGNK